jgi:hypothetical protein
LFVTGSAPVADGLVVSLNRPGGNVTGITSMNTGLAVKQLGLLQQLLVDLRERSCLRHPQCRVFGIVTRAGMWPINYNKNHSAGAPL